MISKIDDGKFMLSNFCIVLSSIKKGEIVSFLKLMIYLSICFDEGQKDIYIFIMLILINYLE